MTTTPPTVPHGLVIHHVLTTKREESTSEDMCNAGQGAWNMSGQGVIAEIRAMSWMIAVILNLLSILTAAFVAGAVQASPSPAMRWLPAVTVGHPSRAVTAAGGRPERLARRHWSDRSLLPWSPGGKVDP